MTDGWRDAELCRGFPRRLKSCLQSAHLRNPAMLLLLLQFQPQLRMHSQFDFALVADSSGLDDSRQGQKIFTHHV